MGQEIIGLINNCLDYFNRNCYTQNRIDGYKSMWKKGILTWMKKKGLPDYTADTGEEFIHSFIREGFVTTKERDYIRSVQALTDFMNLGYVRKRTYIPVKYPLDGEIGRQMQKLIAHLQSLRRSRITIKDYELYLNRFLTFLEHEQVYTVSAIKERHILKFVSTMENNKVNIVSSLRVLFRFWYEEHVIEERFHELLDKYKWVKHEKIPSYFTEAEISMIEKSVERSSNTGKRNYAMLLLASRLGLRASDIAGLKFNNIDWFYSASEISMIEKSVERNSDVGKRNYAMMLLASRLGLRASDIAGLKFNNIDWEKNEIALKQYKTGTPLTLPLLSDVGNALIDYLKNGRFHSDSQYVFLAACAPYVPVTNLAVCSAIRSIILKSGVSVKNRHHGPHALRHSLASRLLENNVSIHVISETLGHTKTDTTLSYLRIDLLSLLKCALPVPPVPDSFYMQKGGVFYE